MALFDFRHLIHAIPGVLERHALGAHGAYRRWAVDDPRAAEDTGPNPYGCADAANILYTIQAFPSDAKERSGWVNTLRELQDSDTGFFQEATHHPIHTTAHCIAALELFDARPLHRLAALHDTLPLHELTAFLESLDWEHNPWRESHRGAGLFAALVLTGEAPLDWQEHYFDWLRGATDPKTGLLRKGCLPQESGAYFPHLAGTFHYLFNMEYARQPLAAPEQLVDTCLEIYASRAYPLGERVSFAEIDWVYCLNRAARHSGHRWQETRRALEDFASRYLPFLMSINTNNDWEFNDLHALFGALCCVAELQAALPGTIRTQRPLRLVLDRRPFI